jgi:hypothetical protein
MRLMIPQIGLSPSWAQQPNHSPVVHHDKVLSSRTPSSSVSSRTLAKQSKLGVSSLIALQDLCLRLMRFLS